MGDPVFSIIIPTRHRDLELARCLTRLPPGSQTASPLYEVIVTDDGSESTSEMVVAHRFPWATWVAGPRRGPAANRNAGARHAKGEFLLFTDDDCIPAPGWLSAFAAAIEPGIDVYEGKTTCIAGFNPLLEEAPVNLSGGCLWSCNFTIRRSVFESLGGFDEDFPLAWCEDLEFGDRLKREGHRCRFVPDAIVDHPPRPRPDGRGEAMRWESRVLLWYKQGRGGSPWTWLPMHVAKVRLARILKRGLSWDSTLALRSLAFELTYVMANLSRWERKYRPRPVQLVASLAKS